MQTTELASQSCVQMDLPKPLTSEEERATILKYEQGDLIARDTLIERNLRLAVFIARKFTSKNDYPLEDLFSIATIGLIKAVDTYDSTKQVKLGTYIAKCSYNEILHFLTRVNIKTAKDVSLDETLANDDDSDNFTRMTWLKADVNIEGDMLMKDEISQLHTAILKLPERERNIVELYYGLNGKSKLSQVDIAVAEGYSQAHIARKLKAITKKLKTLMN